MKCRICGNNERLRLFEFREMMFGFRDIFTYFQCQVCECLQIAEIPQDILKYYPPHYSSFTLPAGDTNHLKSQLKKMRDRLVLSGQGIPARLIALLFPHDILQIYSGIPSESHLLDVGCGSGSLIYRLKEAGFTNMHGVDPFIKESIHYDNGVVVEKKTIDDIDGKWDIITYHHSFEHIPDPFKELKKVSELLNENGSCIIRVPTVDSFAWSHYGSDWIQIDAPRHFYLYSKRSMRLLAESVNLSLDNVKYDSTGFQFWGSEQNKMDLALYDQQSFHINPKNSVFTRSEIREFSRRSEKLNKLDSGDQAIFYLRRLNE